jgi:predicted GH43/DUF377 family glycosyl hydrolase
MHDSSGSPAGLSRRNLLQFPALLGVSQRRQVIWADDSRGKPFSKDPSVVRHQGRYLLYYSLMPRQDDPLKAWGIGIAESRDLMEWRKAGEIQPEGDLEQKGICAPGVLQLDGRLHMFYQTYGGGAKDSICHAVSEDGLKWRRDQTNPVFRASGDWNCGRVIDANVIVHKGSLLMLGATRDPGYKTQMLVAARAPMKSDYGRGSWTQAADHSVLKPELAWEKSCIEAPSMIERGGRLWCFYAGGYNNEPQQVGVAVSSDGVNWSRHSDKPFLANGQPGEWNSSESGHPGIFEDGDRRTYLFFQGNSDKGRTWSISWIEVGWNRRGPFLIR